jgi:hypothetical protein
MSPTAKSLGTQADFNKIRAAFMQRVSAPHILPHAFKLAWLLAYRYMNRETLTARPAQETLARDLNVSIRTVQRLLDILEPLGLTVIPGDGRGHASTYAIDPERATRVSSFRAKRVTPVSPIDDEKGDIRRQKGRHPATEKGDTGVAPTLIREPRREPRVESDSPPADFFGDVKKDSRGEERIRKKARAVPAESFEEFWRVYPKRIAKETARKAFNAAIKRGATADVLIAGARRYAGERAGQESRYTKHPATWLNGGCWHDEPAARADGPPIIDGVTGEPVAAAPSRRRNEPKTWAELVEEVNAEVGDGYLH